MNIEKKKEENNRHRYFLYFFEKISEKIKLTKYWIKVLKYKYLIFNPAKNVKSIDFTLKMW